VMTGMSVLGAAGCASGVGWVTERL
jgi:hypothetical protein